ALLAAELDQAADRGAALAPRAGARRVAVSLPGEPQGDRLSARVAGRDDPVRRQPVAHRPGGRARPRRVPRPAGRRGLGAQRLSEDWRIDLPAHLAAAKFLLV